MFCLPMESHYQRYESAVQFIYEPLEGIAMSKMRIKNRSSSGWREIGGQRKYFRSMWEANYARYLQYLKKMGHIKNWEHEPQTFWFHAIKRGTITYLPDFKITRNDDTHYWVEVKGYMDSKSQTKIKRFKKYYPDEILEVKGKKWFNDNSPMMSILCKGWEAQKKSIPINIKKYV